MGAQVNALLHKFSAGEVSSAALARVDQERIRLTAETQENLFPHAIGKGQVRPGTKYIGATRSNSQARFLPFIKNIDNTALLEMTDGKLRVWVDEALVTRPSVSSSISNGAFSLASATVTVSGNTVTWTAHGFSAGQAVTFSTTGTLPTGISAGTTYYVISAGLATDSFRFSTTAGGSAVTTTGTQSGVHTGNAGWVVTTSGAATATVASGYLAMAAPAKGGTAIVKQAVTIATANTEHALQVTVDRGPVIFRVGSTDGGDEYIAETEIDTGDHHLAFTPTTGYFYVQFQCKSLLEKRVSNCTVEGSGVLAIDAPWTTAQLREINYDQSGDIVFLAHESWQQRKIERRGDTSWSLTKYEVEDGPFTTSRTANITLTPGATSGNTTLTSDRPFFKSTHVGALFRLYHQGQKVITVLGGADQYTDPIRVNGIDADRVFTWSITGTWTGGIARQRSYDGEDTGFIDYNATLVSSNTSSFLNDTYDNSVIWYRFGFKPGNYTSGSATITLTFAGGGGRGICRVVGFNSATSVNIEVLEPFKGITPSTDWLEGEWSDKRGWPSAVRFFDGRLWWAGRDKFWGSQSNSYYSYDADADGDGGSIQRSVATGGAVSRVQWLLPLQRLIIGTQSSEVSARSSAFDEPLTPTNLTLKDASTQGAAALSPVKFDGRGIFVQRSGSRSYQLKFDFDASDYVAAPLMRMTEDIGGDGIVALAVQRQPESYIWHVREDGECPILLYDPAEDVECWIRFITDGADGEVEDVVVLPGTTQDAVYLSVKRTILGSTVRYLERLARHKDAIGGSTNLMADSYVFESGPVSSVTAAHLASETGLVGWGTTGGVLTPLTGLSADGSGVIPLGAAYSNVCVGLPYNWRYKSSRLAYGAKQGTALLQPKRVTQLGLIASNMHPSAVTFAGSFDSDTFDPLPRIENGTAVSTTPVVSYDEQTFPFPDSGWDTDSRVCLKGSAPYPATLLGLVVGIETNET